MPKEIALQMLDSLYNATHSEPFYSKFLAKLQD